MKKERKCAKENNEDRKETRKEETKKERRRNQENERKPLQLSPIAKPLARMPAIAAEDGAPPSTHSDAFDIT